MSKFEFETHCFDSQKCGATTTGCLVGQCLRKNCNTRIKGDVVPATCDSPLRVEDGLDIPDFLRRGKD